MQDERYYTDTCQASEEDCRAGSLASLSGARESRAGAESRLGCRNSRSMAAGRGGSASSTPTVL